MRPEELSDWNPELQADIAAAREDLRERAEAEQAEAEAALEDLP